MSGNKILTPDEIAEKYVHGKHNALTDSQEKKDMISDIMSYAKFYAQKVANEDNQSTEQASHIQNVNDISIADINDAPVFAHTLRFREHFNYIKSEFIRLLSCR